MNPIKSGVKAGKKAFGPQFQKGRDTKFGTTAPRAGSVKAKLVRAGAMSQQGGGSYGR